VRGERGHGDRDREAYTERCDCPAQALHDSVAWAGGPAPVARMMIVDGAVGGLVLTGAGDFVVQVG
jgi:hypothetical protein